ncbi:CaiB/BaiF CoA transferase family protein [Streptomyces monticola]|uniref:CaiB/BaiF CoA transferase family protein n=1 Tax=Streptomyces monticola TaxID=2666263 RepID=A0ABW2JY77_9ACTN
MTTTDTHTPRPLDGIRVIDLASVVMGPYAAQILGDLGADVIKIEAPDGDVMRMMNRRDSESDIGGISLNLNRNKRSAALDLKTPEGREAALALVGTADVLITNMRPKALKKLGLTYDDLAAAHPGLIYCNAQGFRSDSAYADLPAYDEVVQATSGMVDLMRRATGEAHYVPTILADKVCGLTIAYSVLAALVARQRTGRGQHVEVPMTDTMFAFTLVEHLAGGAYAAEHDERAAGSAGFARSLSPGHRAYATKDGWACILPYSHRNFTDFFDYVGRPEVMADERFATPDGVRRNTPALYDEVAKETGRHTTDEWAGICAGLNIPFGRVLDIDRVDSHPYWSDGGMLRTVRHPSEGDYRAVGNPVRFDGEPVPMRRHCPRVGEHTGELLAEAGWSEERIAALRSRVEA